MEPEAAVVGLKNLVESDRSGLDPARQARVSGLHQQVEAQWEHEEKATKKIKAKRYAPSVSPHISVVLKLCTGEVGDLSESDIEPSVEYDEDLPVKPAAEDRPVPQKSVEGPAPDVRPTLQR